MLILDIPNGYMVRKTHLIETGKGLNFVFTEKWMQLTLGHCLDMEELAGYIRRLIDVEGMNINNGP